MVINHKNEKYSIGCLFNIITYINIAIESCYINSFDILLFVIFKFFIILFMNNNYLFYYISNNKEKIKQNRYMISG